MDPSRERSGSNEYGPLEYILIAGLGILTIGFLYTLFGADVRSWIGDLFAPDTPAGGPQIEVVETGNFLVTADEEIIPVRNCDSTSEEEFEIERVRVLQHQFVFDETFDPEVAQVLLLSLERHYEFQDNQEVERRYLLRMSAGADSGADYIVQWQEVWVEGEVVVSWPEGEQDRVPYQALTDQEFLFLSSREVSCSP